MRIIKNITFIFFFLFVLACRKSDNLDIPKSSTVAPYYDTLYYLGSSFPGTAKISNGVLEIHGTSKYEDVTLCTSDTTLGQHILGSDTSKIYLKVDIRPRPSGQTQQDLHFHTTSSDTGLLLITKINSANHTISGTFTWNTGNGSFSHIHW